MKPQLIRVFGLMAGGLLLAHVASATVTTISYYRLGENDPGAVAGKPANAVTVDSGAAGVNLHQLGPPPTYSTNTGVAGSTLCIDVDGGGYTNGAPIPTPSTNWGIEAWVLATSTANPLSSDGYALIAYNGNTSTAGMGLYASPSGTFFGLCGGVAFVGSAPIVPGTWTHLAMVYADGKTTLYVNGVENTTGSAPNPLSGFFGIGTNPSKAGGWEQFQGSIDEVRVFAFEEGAFTTNDLLLSSVPPPPEAPTIFAGPTLTPAGALVSGTQFFATGSPFSLGVVVGGNGPCSYQWRTTTNLPGATNATLSFASPTTNNSGNYSVVVTNAYGAVTSSVVSVGVMPPGSGLIPLAYYRLGENDPGAVAGQNADNPTVDLINGVNLYQFEVPPIYDSHTGVAGSTLCIDVDGGCYETNMPLTAATDNWGIEAWVKTASTTPALSSDGLAEIVYNGDDTADGMGILQNSAGQFVGLSAQVAWVPSSAGGAPIKTNTWTHLALVTTGGTVTFYTNGVSMGSVSGGHPLTPTSYFSIGGSPLGTEFFQGSIDEVRIFAVLPGQFSVSDLLLTQVPPGAEPPQVVSGPIVNGAPVVLGNSFSVDVVVSGTYPLSYQWRQGGTAISGATNSAFIVTSATTNASGGYDVVITNLYGAKTSSVVNVTVLSAGASSVVPLAYYRLGENDPGAVAGMTADNPTIDLINGLNLYQLGTPPTYDTNTGVAGSTLCIDVDGGGYTNATPIAVPSTNWGLEAWVLATSASNPLSSDGYAQIVYNGNSGPSGMGLYASPSGAFVALCGGVALFGDAPIVPGKWTHLAVVYTGGKTTFYVNGVVNATGPAPNPLSGWFGVGINPAKPGFEEFQGSIDEVRVFGVVPGKFSVSDLLLTEVPPGPEAPKVVSSSTLSSSLVGAGTSFSLSVVASGSALLSYQWYRGGVAVSGATTASLTLTNLTTSESGGYDLIITNQYGSATSAVVNVTVLPAGASGVTPLAYYRLGENDPGAAAGHTGNATTVDLINGVNLYQIGTPPTYSSNTGVPGSTLSLAVNGGGYTNMPFQLSDNWGLEAWVYSTNADNPAPGEGDIAFNGNYAASGGMGLFQYGTTWNGLVSGIAWITGPTVVTNQWTHLAIVTTGGTTTLYVNGVAKGTGPTPAPATTVGDFSIGDDANPYAGRASYFQGLIDEVRVFTFAPGLFTTNDLLLASAPPPLTVSAVPAGTSIIVFWSGEGLQQAGKLTGPWTTISNAIVPWVAPETGVSQFFRAAGQ